MKNFTISGLVVECYQDPGHSGWAGGEVKRRGTWYVSVTDSDGKSYCLIDDPDESLEYEGSKGDELPPPHILDVLHEAYGLAFGQKVGED